MDDACHSNFGGETLHRAVFLDRDGVLTKKRSDYVKTPAELELLPGIGGPLKRLQEHGYLLVVVTNQSAIGRGLTTHEEMSRIHQKLRSELQKVGIEIEAIYYCPHTPVDRCNCRKPSPGLIQKAAIDFEIDTSRSWLIGDKQLDVEAANRAGCRAIRVPTNGTGLGEADQIILTSSKAEEKGPEIVEN